MTQKNIWPKTSFFDNVDTEQTGEKTDRQYDAV